MEPRFNNARIGIKVWRWHRSIPEPNTNPTIQRAIAQRADCAEEIFELIDD